MGFANQVKVESTTSCKGSNHTKKRKIFKNRNKGLLKKYGELRTLCGVRALLFVDSEYNKDKKGSGSVTMLPENPDEFGEIYKDYINHDPKAKKRKGGSTDHQGVFGSECNKMSKDANFNNQKSFGTNLGDLSVEDIEKIERNLDPIFTRISERLMEKSNSIASSGCSDVIMVNEFPLCSLPIEPKFDYQASSYTDLLNSPVLGNEEFDYGCVNQETWFNLPELTTTDGDDSALAPFPDMIHYDFEPLSCYAGTLIY